MKEYNNFIFDLDDTILQCGVYYVNKRKELIEYSSKRTGFSPESCERLFVSMEKERVTLPDGYSRTGFPRSFAATSIVLDVLLGNKINEDAAEQCYLIGESVFNEEYPIVDNAIKILDVLKSKQEEMKYNLFLYSKGDFSVQTKKIINNKLHEYFPTANTYIVPHKGYEYINKIFQDHNLDKQSTIVIGDSLIDDITSANLIGCDSVWVKKYAWDTNIDSAEKTPTYIIETIDELLFKLER